jgi:hypothetical protein
MKKSTFLLPVLALALTLISCNKITGKGDVIAEKRSITGFTAISLSMEGDVHFTPDTVYLVEVDAQQNILDVIETNVEGSTLVLKIQDNTILGKHEPIRFYIHAPSVKDLDISGSGNIYTSPVMSQPELGFNISGSGSTNISEVMCHQLNGRISGSGNITGSAGTTDYETLTISGSGNMNFLDVIADTVYVNISGSGDAKVNAVKFLDVTISGSGNVRYDGNPIISQHISGSGSVVHN